MVVERPSDRGRKLPVMSDVEIAPFQDQPPESDKARSMTSSISSRICVCLMQRQLGWIGERRCARYSELILMVAPALVQSMRPISRVHNG